MPPYTETGYPDPYPPYPTFAPIPPQPPQQHPSPPIPQRHASIGNINQSDSGVAGNVGVCKGPNRSVSYDNEGGRSSSEEKDVLAPSQDRRKAQNRAA